MGHPTGLVNACLQALIRVAGTSIIFLDQTNSKSRDWSHIVQLLWKYIVSPIVYIFVVAPCALVVALSFGLQTWDVNITSAAAPPKLVVAANPSSTTISEECIKVMSFNIRCGANNKAVYNLKATAAVIRKSGASVVMLQEVTIAGQHGQWVGTTHLSSPPWCTVKADQVAQLATLTGLHHYASYGVHQLARGGSYGIGVLSRLPISEVRRHRFRDWGFPREARGALAVRVPICSTRGVSKGDGISGSADGHWWFVCTHLQSDVTGLQQAEEAAELVEFVRGLRVSKKRSKGAGGSQSGRICTRRTQRGAAEEDSNEGHRDRGTTARTTRADDDDDEAEDCGGDTSREAGVVVAGDLNAMPFLRAPKLLSKAFGPSLCYAKSQATFPWAIKHIKLDYMWLLADEKHMDRRSSHGNSAGDTDDNAGSMVPMSRCTHFEVMQDVDASDHFPLLATIRIC